MQLLDLEASGWGAWQGAGPEGSPSAGEGWRAVQLQPHALGGASDLLQRLAKACLLSEGLELQELGEAVRAAVLLQAVLVATAALCLQVQLAAEQLQLSQVI